MVANQRNLILKKGNFTIPGFSVDDFLDATTHYPDHIMPAYRKARNYVSAFLSGNEVLRTYASPSCKALFYRIQRGYYIINPLVEIGIGDEWFNYYDVFLRLDELRGVANRNLELLIQFLPNYRKQVTDFLQKGSDD